MGERAQAKRIRKYKRDCIWGLAGDIQRIDYIYNSRFETKTECKSRVDRYKSEAIKLRDSGIEVMNEAQLDKVILRLQALRSRAVTYKVVELN